VLVAVNELDGIQAEATVADAKELKVQVDGAIEKVRVANKALNAATINELLTSYDALSATLDGLDDDAAIGDASVQMQVALAGVKTALEQAGSALKCA
jgi:hypothetical protein